MSDNETIEDLLLATLDAVSRFRVGQREAVAAALDAGALLTEAKDRLPHGAWGEWLGRVGLVPRTASTWMRLAKMGLTAADVIERGGINASAQRCWSQIGNRCRFEHRSSAGPGRRRSQQSTRPSEAYYEALNQRHRGASRTGHHGTGRGSEGVATKCKTWTGGIRF